LIALDPAYDAASVRPKRPYRQAKLFGGRKLPGLILDALRRAERPLTTQEVVSAIADGNASAPNVTKRVRMALRYLAKRGAVAKEGERKSAKWTLVVS
jgi:predicted deacylase